MALSTTNTTVKYKERKEDRFCVHEVNYYYQATFTCTAQNRKITVWIKDQNQRKMPLSLMSIQKKRQKVFAHT
jgi:hypothetical protein